jgi:hypothetical protein
MEDGDMMRADYIITKETIRQGVRIEIGVAEIEQAQPEEAKKTFFKYINDKQKQSEQRSKGIYRLHKELLYWRIS